jgi:hypothetical protein
MYSWVVYLGRVANAGISVFSDKPALTPDAREGSKQVLITT